MSLRFRLGASRTTRRIHADQRDSRGKGIAREAEGGVRAAAVLPPCTFFSRQMYPDVNGDTERKLLCTVTAMARDIGVQDRVFEKAHIQIE